MDTKRRLMMGIIIMLGSGVVSTATISLASGTTWYVATHGSGADGLSWGTAFTNIQTAIDAVQSNETICLAAHTFNIGTNAAMTGQINISKSYFAIQGGYAGDGTPGSRTNQPTVITLQSGTNRLFFLGGVTNVTLDNLTLVNGFANLGEYGGGLFVTNSTNVMVSSCVFATNHVKGASGGTSVAIGGGLYVVNSGMLVSNCQFTGNYAYPGDVTADRSAYGGGAACVNSTVLFRDCVARLNWTQEANWGGRAYGGAFYFNGGATTLRNCLVYGNYLIAGRITEEAGHGIYVAGGAVAIENCDILNNRREGATRVGGTLTVRDSIVRGHLANDLISPTWTSNSIVGLSTNPDFERGIYLAASSPAVDAGSRTVFDAGLSGTTTRADGTPDSDPVDLGYHSTGGVDFAKADLYVAGSGGSDARSGTNWAEAFKTISNALSAAVEGTRIHVGVGLYNTNSGERFPITLSKPGQQLLGASAETTIIDAMGAGMTAVMLQGVVGDGRIEGVTIRNADGNTYYGGGIYASDSDLTLVSCTLSNNNVRNKTLQGTGYGGGLYALNCGNILVSNVTFRGNTASGAGNGAGFGGGVYFETTRGTILNSTLVSNTAAAQGSGVIPYGGGMALNGSSTRVVNTVVAGNRCTRNDDSGTAGRFAHGAYVTGGSAGFENCTFVTNVGAGGAISYGEGLRVASATVSATNCIFWSHVMDITGSVVLAYCDIENGTSNGVNGNISADPQFVSMASNNFHLLKTSPCLNAGINLPWMAGGVDLDGNPRITERFVDIGVYEGRSVGMLLMVQ